ncbi:hypothetical protein [Amycolatopsis sp. NPDC059021]|uniref:hypothetical protein n=1 Tax=Amycolatopsis sp. NPDC059021 TaxID=3346704 RepID=UPI0036703A32
MSPYDSLDRPVWVRMRNILHGRNNALEVDLQAVVYVEPDSVFAARGHCDLVDDNWVASRDADVYAPAALDGLRTWINFVGPVAIIAPGVIDHGRVAALLGDLHEKLSEHSFPVATLALDPGYEAATEIVTFLVAARTICARTCTHQAPRSTSSSSSAASIRSGAVSGSSRSAHDQRPLRSAFRLNCVRRANRVRSVFPVRACLVVG